MYRVSIYPFVFNSNLEFDTSFPLSPYYFRSNFISGLFFLFFFFRDQNYFFNNIRDTQKYLVIINLFSTNDGSGWFNLKCIHASMKIILLIEIDIFVKFIIIFHSVNPDTKNKKSFLWVDIFYEKKNKNSEISWKSFHIRWSITHKIDPFL